VLDWGDIFHSCSIKTYLGVNQASIFSLFRLGDVSFKLFKAYEPSPISGGAYSPRPRHRISVGSGSASAVVAL
jgi:hypothetical protein